MNLGKQVANALSYVLSPNVFAFYIILILLLYPPLESNSNIIINLILSIVFLCIFPIIAILYYHQKGTIDIWVSKQEDRTPFYIIAIIGYLIASIIFYSIDQWTLFVLSIAYLFVTISVTLGNFYTKVSSHSAGVAGPLTAITLLYGIFSIPFLLIIPLVFWARLKLKAHTFSQLSYGIIIGVIVTFTVFYLLFPVNYSQLL